MKQMEIDRTDMTGHFAISKAGHDKSALYVIIAQEGEFCFLCDGRLKTLQKPKKKRLKHIQVMSSTVDTELLELLKKKEVVYDEQIKYAIKRKVKKMEEMYV